MERGGSSPRSRWAPGVAGMVRRLPLARLSLVLLCVGAIAINEMAFMGVMAFLPDFASGEKGLDRTWVRSLYAVQAGFGVLFSLLAPILIRRFTNASVLS
eukprot:2435025-Prymnesium_polylepis.1